MNKRSLKQSNSLTECNQTNVSIHVRKDSYLVIGAIWLNSFFIHFDPLKWFRSMPVDAVAIIFNNVISN